MRLENEKTRFGCQADLQHSNAAVERLGVAKASHTIATQLDAVARLTPAAVGAARLTKLERQRKLDEETLRNAALAERQG
jgi:hypothetical protein